MERSDTLVAAPERTGIAAGVPVESPAAPAEGREAIPLAEALRQIGRDGRREPGRYLAETEAPCGGE